MSIIHDRIKKLRAERGLTLAYVADYLDVTEETAQRYETGKGILYLLTGGIFAFGWIFDIIKIATGGFKDNAGAPLRQ